MNVQPRQERGLRFPKNDSSRDAPIPFKKP
jgi:hypothetical protein